MAGFSQLFPDRFSLIFLGVGILLIFLGGIGYALLLGLLIPFTLLTIIIGTVIFFQSSRAFQAKSFWTLILVITLSVIVVIFIDIWPLQYFFAHVVAVWLLFLNVPFTQYALQHFGGVQILLFVEELGSAQLVGGEIDNACAGLIVLIPCLLLLLFADKAHQSPMNKLGVGLLAILIIIGGNVIRIIIELSVPALTLVPFDWVHYPLAFILGLLGLIVIAVAGQKFVLRQKDT